MLFDSDSNDIGCRRHPLKSALADEPVSVLVDHHDIPAVVETHPAEHALGLLFESPGGIKTQKLNSLCGGLVLERDPGNCVAHGSVRSAFHTHLINPRSAPSITRISISTSSPRSASAFNFSSACDVFNFE